MSGLRALIWDVDGTLAETEADGHRVAFNRAFAERGLDWQWDDATYGRLLAITGGKERIAHWWRQVDPAAAADGTAPSFVAALHAAKSRHYEALVAAGAVALRPGVVRLLEEARRARLTLAIATTTQPGNVRALLQHTLGDQAIGWFDVIGAGDVVPAKKPAPDIHRWVLARLGLAPTQALAIEDSAPGVAAACAAGLPVLAVRSRYTRGDCLAGALAVLDSLDDDGAGAPVTLATLRRWHAKVPAAQATPGGSSAQAAA